jgi:hypothetical protein
MEDSSALSLYETDFIAWAEQQAEALRGVPNLKGHGVDVENLIEEVEALGREELRKFEDSIRSAVLRLIRAAFEPDAELARIPASEVTGFLREAMQHVSPTVLDRIVPDRLWAEAWEEAETLLPEGALPDGPGPCPFATDRFLLNGFVLRKALERIRALPFERPDRED